jgi:O-antigen/teichoic acid export membrane protein
MFTTDIFTLGSYQIQTFLVAGLLGLEAAGVLRAMQAFTLPMVQVITAIGVIGLPVLSNTFAQQGLAALQRKGLLVTACLSVAAGLYALVLVLLAGPLEHVLYGGKFVEFLWVIAIFCLLPLFGAVAQGYSLMLRALRRPTYYIVVGLVPSAAGLLSAAPLIWAGGLGGAALSIVLTSAVSAATNYWLYRRWIVPLPRASRDEALAA